MSRSIFQERILSIEQRMWAEVDRCLDSIHVLSRLDPGHFLYEEIYENYQWHHSQLLPMFKDHQEMIEAWTGEFTFSQWLCECTKLALFFKVPMPIIFSLEQLYSAEDVFSGIED